MRKWVAVLLLVTLLFGCSNGNETVDHGLAVRKLFMDESGVRFVADIVADYGDMRHSFSVQCEASLTGDIKFTVIKPDTINGIEGVISASGGKLQFADKILLFEPLVFGQISPALAPWLLVKAIQGGYIRSQSIDRDSCQLLIEDTYQSADLQVILTLNEDNIPTCGEIIWSNRRILTVYITQFDKL